MIYKATQEIVNAFQEKKLTYDVLEDDKVSRVIGNVNGKVLDYQIQFISKDDGNDVAVRAYNLVKFPEEKQKAMILFANQCNSKYR